jgi:hypothetical protein
MHAQPPPLSRRPPVLEPLGIPMAFPSPVPRRCVGGHAARTRALRPHRSAGCPHTHLCPCTCRLHSIATSLRNVPPAWLVGPSRSAPARTAPSACSRTVPAGHSPWPLRVAPLARTLRPLISSVSVTVDSPGLNHHPTSKYHYGPPKI